MKKHVLCFTFAALSLLSQYALGQGHLNRVTTVGTASATGIGTVWTFTGQTNTDGYTYNAGPSPAALFQALGQLLLQSTSNASTSGATIASNGLISSSSFSTVASFTQNAAGSEQCGHNGISAAGTVNNVTYAINGPNVVAGDEFLVTGTLSITKSQLQAINQGSITVPE